MPSNTTKHVNTDKLEMVIRSQPWSASVDKMYKDDFNAILALDKSIFPDESIFNCEYYYHEKYSIIARDPASPTRIAGYLFAKPLVNNSILIGNIAVNPDYQKSGLGSELMRDIISKAKGARIDLQVRVGNKNAQLLYKKFGFKESSRNDSWIQMYLPAIAPIVSVTTKEKAEPANKYQTDKGLSYNFYLKCIFGIGSGLAFVSLACLLLPPVGVFAIGAVAGYASSTIGFSIGFSMIGIFGHKILQDKPIIGDPRSDLNIIAH